VSWAVCRGSGDCAIIVVVVAGVGWVVRRGSGDCAIIAVVVVGVSWAVVSVAVGDPASGARSCVRARWVD